ncbi:MAG: T9SS type A sorting domain-containing protein [Chitinophagaceae bacterium]|jgi:hypothetical protein
MKLSVVTIFCTFFCLQSFAQHNSNQVPFVIHKAATVNLSEIYVDWNPVLQNVEAPKPDGNKTTLQKIKDSLSKVYPKKSQMKDAPQQSPSKKGNTKKTTALTAPFMGRNFLGNLFSNSTPNDNDIAVSNGNKLLSVQNTTIYTCDAGDYAGTYRSLSLSAFAYKLPNPHSKFDPKALYDPSSDKFIILFLNGFTDSTSSISVAFSHTNDPNGTWSLYELPGNPLNNGLWSDFPMFAVTEKELFITINLLYPDSSWQTGFNETLIWQIDKNTGYGGLSLNSLLHHDIKFNGRAVRNLCPVKGGSKNYGPDMYFLSNRNLDAQNDTVFMVHVTDTIGAPGLAVDVKHLIAPHAYFAPPNALQPGPGGTQTLATNDARMMGAFIENDKIQYVHNTLDTASGNAAVYHGVINNVSTSPIIAHHIIRDPLLEFGYANISYMGNSSTDNSAIINFDHSAATVFPGVSALKTDGAGDYSPIMTVKPGVAYVRVLGGNERWGDYSGSQRKYNQPGRVWVNGLFGNTSKQNTTWIAELAETSLVNIPEPEAGEQNSLSIYPNPTSDRMTVQIVLDKADYLEFQLFDMNGKLVNLLLRERVKKGKNNFSFSTAPLSSGNYVLRVNNAQQEVFAQQFVKQ